MTMPDSSYEKHVSYVLSRLKEYAKQVIIYRLYDGSMIAVDQSFKIANGGIELAKHPDSICTVEQVVRVQYDFVDLTLTLWVD